jgi:hypothetical protein
MLKNLLKTWWILAPDEVDYEANHRGFNGRNFFFLDSSELSIEEDVGLDNASSGHLPRTVAVLRP